MITQLRGRAVELEAEPAACRGGASERAVTTVATGREQALEPRTGDAPAEELQEKADRMKKRLENLGDVNPTAIEAFTEMKKRYDFIVEQKTDLINAKESLLKTKLQKEDVKNK